MKTPEEILQKHVPNRFPKDNPYVAAMEEYASQSKPQLNIEKVVSGIVDSLGEPSNDNDYHIHSVNGNRWITHNEVGSGEPLKQWLKSEIEKHIEQSKPQEIPEENRQKLFNHMSTEHGLTLLESEMNSIYSICIGHEEYVKYLNWLHSKPVDTKTVDAVDTTFWRRLEMFVSNIQVNDMAGEEEKQYIIHVIESKK